MQFYKICGVISDGNGNDENNEAIREIMDVMPERTEEFNGAEQSQYCFLAAKTKKAMTFGAIIMHRVNLSEFAEKYAKHVGLDFKITSVNEITFESMRNLLRQADRSRFIDDYNDVIERFDLISMNRREVLFGENLVNACVNKAELIALSKKHFMNETLIPELERIYEGSKCSKVTGHPVHYVVETDDRDKRREVYKIILDALYANKRLENCRYTFLDIRTGEDNRRAAYETLYRASEGGAVVIRYTPGGESGDDYNASAEYETIETICDLAKLFRNKVLTVICFPRECKKIKSRFYENLGNMSFVEVREDLIDSEGAKRFLSGLAREKGVRADKKLFASIDADSAYLSTSLTPVFDDWYDKKLKSSVYPQYKDIAVARKDVLKAKPRGSAYDELNEMIGLDEAKRVIKKALNYYKMQKLYEEKGVRAEAPAMHMVFSGNPGTAKTTVARLFARIMRENGLLSCGQLVEVGRSDLVGKYVGWTAKIVKSKFNAARGGVLFIDEAYSLVDDRDGSYGDEAINTIVQEMENHRADVVVIFAGYPDKMEEFIQKNPGLRSRIAFHVPFADYNSGELCKIADMISKKNGMKIDNAAFDKLERAFDIARANADFGNGRYVRNVFEQAKMNQASRLLEKDFDEISDDEIITITADDIIIPENKKADKRVIGFC